MTCIVGYRTSSRVFIGGDSAATADTLVTRGARPKVFKSGKYIFGYSGSFRSGQLLEVFVSASPFKSKLAAAPKDAFLFLVTTFIPALRKELKKSGDLGTDDGRELGFPFLVGVGNRIFRVDSDFQVLEPIDCYAALGCGEPVALGALWVLDNLKAAMVPWDAEAVVRLSLEATAHQDNGVLPPFTIVST